MPLVTFSRGIVALCALTVAGAANAQIHKIDFTDQGSAGNFGDWFRPANNTGVLAPVWLTARDDIDASRMFEADATGRAGSLFANGGGLGVQDLAGGGSLQISGTIGDSIEEVFLSFDRAITPEFLVVAIGKYSAGNGLGNGDDPCIFVLLSGGMVRSFDETNGIVAESGQIGRLKLGQLLDPTDRVEGIVIRETRRHITLDSLVFNEIVPAPGPIALLGVAAVVFARRRRR